MGHKERAKLLSDTDCESIIRKLFGEKISIKDISSKKDMRNKIYVVGKFEYIFKAFGDQRRWKREIAGLLMIRSSQFFSPKLIDFGMCNTGIGWCLMTYVSGVFAEDRYQNKFNSLLWKDMGQLLAELHMSTKMTREECKFLVAGAEGYMKKNYKDYQHNKEKIVKNLYWGHKEIFENVFSIIEQWFSKKGSTEPTYLSLCHNDYSLRNVLYNEKHGKYVLIDFEQSEFAEVEKDFSRVLIELIPHHLEDKFIKGYAEFGMTYDMEKVKIYLFLKIIEICSWSFEREREYFEDAFSVLASQLKLFVRK
ncbi:MAG: aminoglycoside phosphotransferase family protein [Eubacterium sp.]|jgi:Phosphotransferase enzyme family.|nr:aminoglycoside phosphotransferase family protein [Eubacterium sp.]